MTATTWATLDKATGGLSAPGKMPGAAWSIPAEFCKVGSILRERCRTVRVQNATR